VSRTDIALGANQRLNIAPGPAYPLAISRDGKAIAYVANQRGATSLVLRMLDEDDPRELPGTEGARHPFFAPDGQQVGFFRENRLERVSVLGGTPIVVTTVEPGTPGGASWGSEGTIVFATGSGLFLVPETGGQPARVEMGDPQSAPAQASDSTAYRRGVVRWPEHLPDGDHVIFSRGTGTHVVDLRTGELRSVFEGTQAHYLSTNHLIFHAGQERIRVIPFDPRSQEVHGSETSVVDGVFRGPGGGAAIFAVSGNGTLVYQTGSFERTLWSVDREGREAPIGVAARGFRFPRVSPDGDRLAVIVDPRPSALWLVNLQRSAAAPLRSGDHHVDPAWAPDGERLGFAWNDDQHWIRFDEPEEPTRVASRPGSQYQPSWSDEGLVMVSETTPENGLDLVILDGRDGTSRAFLATPANESDPAISPDGAWVAYTTDASGVQEVHVAAFPGPGGSVVVSEGGGVEPTWSADGTELFYRRGVEMWAARVRTGSNFEAEAHTMLFDAARYDFSQVRNWDVGPDGRFVMVKGDPSGLSRLRIVQNWFEELRSIVPD
jgi:Tol biopolymer transport system component